MASDDTSATNDMNDGFEAAVQRRADELIYPATPNVARRVRVRLSDQRTSPRSLRYLILWVALGMLALGSAAVLWSVLRIGAVRIVLPPQTATPSVGGIGLSVSPSSTVFSPTLTTSSTAPAIRSTMPVTALRRIIDLRGETTLIAARAAVTFTIPLPTYPADLGMPDFVYLQHPDGRADMVLLVWMDRRQPDKVRMSLHLLTADVFARKLQPRVVRETQVRGQRAAWVEGEHLFVLRNGRFEIRRLVTGNTLVWEQAGITFRLESSSTMDEAVRVAESLR